MHRALSGFLCALAVAACGAPAPTVAPAVSRAPLVAEPAVPPNRDPVLVVQSIPQPSHAAFSPDGRFIAIMNQGVTVIDTKSGAVKGSLSECVEWGEFDRKGDELLVLGCERTLDSQSKLGSWNLRRDEYREIGSGRWISTGSETPRRVKWDRDRSLVIDAATGTIVSSVERFTDQWEQDHDRTGRYVIRESRSFESPRETEIATLDGKEVWRGQAYVTMAPHGSHFAVSSTGKPAPADGAWTVRELPSGKVLYRASDRCNAEWGRTPERFAVTCGTQTTVHDGSGRELCRVPAADKLVFSRDGAWLVAYDVAGAQLEYRLWRVDGCIESRHEKLALKERYRPETFVSEDGQRLGFEDGPTDKGELVVVELATGRQQRFPMTPRPSTGGYDYRFDPQKDSIVWTPSSPNNRFTVEVKTAKGVNKYISGRPRYEVGPTTVVLPGDRRAVLAGKYIQDPSENVRFELSPSGRFIQGRSQDRVLLWDATSGALRIDAPLQGYSDSGPRLVPRNRLAMSADEERVSVLDTDAVEIFDTKKGKLIARFEGGSFGVWSPRDSLMTLDHVGMVDGSTGATLWSAKFFPEEPWTADGKFVLTGVGMQHIRLVRISYEAFEVRDARTGEMRARIARDAPLTILDWGVSRKMILTANGMLDAGTADLWSTTDWSHLGSIENTRGAQLSTDERFVTFARADHSRIHRLTDHATLATFIVGTQQFRVVRSADPAKDGRYFPQEAAARLRNRLGPDVLEGELVAVDASRYDPELATGFLAE